MNLSKFRSQTVESHNVQVRQKNRYKKTAVLQLNPVCSKNTDRTRKKRRKLYGTICL